MRNIIRQPLVFYKRFRHVDTGISTQVPVPCKERMVTTSIRVSSSNRRPGPEFITMRNHYLPAHSSRCPSSSPCEHRHLRQDSWVPPLRDG